MNRDTIVDRLIHNARTRPWAPALHSTREGQWSFITWEGYAAKARQFAGALLARGYQPGEAIVIMGTGCPEWVIADVGAMMVRGVPAGIYQTSTPEQATYVATHAEARVAVVENASYLGRLPAAQNPRIERVVVMRGPVDDRDPRAVTFEAFCAEGAAHAAAVDTRFAALQDDDLATLIYTSGTTGPPKGAMLSHRNLASASRVVVDLASGAPTDSLVSYLPLSHIAEQMLTLHASITAGYPVWFADSLDKLRETLLVVRPTLMLGVPRVWEKFKAALEGRFAEARGIKGRILKWSRAVGLRAGYGTIATGAPHGVLAVQARLAQRLFFKPLAAQLGLDRLRLAATGAAPISLDVLEFFLSCGIVLREVYGQTEGTGLATWCVPRPGQSKLGTVGKPLPGIDVSLAPDGEIIVRGPNVFMGYFKDPTGTQAALIDGALQTGDIGAFDAEGFLRITDRKKDLIITAGGKNVAPQNIEKLLQGIEGVAQSVVIGDRQKYLTALITVSTETAALVARTHGWSADPALLVTSEPFRAHVQAGIDAVNAQLARYETIKRFTLLPRDFSLEQGELTPTQKIKRKVVWEHCAREIAAMYTETNESIAS